jgi:hypothetical protein
LPDQHEHPDPWEPSRWARLLEAKVSVASVLLLTEATLTEIPDAKKNAAAPPMEM